MTGPYESLQTASASPANACLAYCRMKRTRVSNPRPSAWKAVDNGGAKRNGAEMRLRCDQERERGVALLTLLWVDETTRMRVEEAAHEAGDWLEARQRLQDATPEGDEESARPFVWGFGYMLIPETAEERRERWRCAFGPILEAGELICPPPLLDVEDPVLEEWNELVSTSSDELVLSRFHDLLWERRYGDRPDLHARAASDAYLIVSSRDGLHRVEGAECIVRAVELARLVSDNDRLDKAIRAGVEAINSALEEEGWGPGVPLRLLRPLVLLPPETQPDEVTELLDRTGRRYGADPHIAEAVVELQASVAENEEARTELRRREVETWRSSAHESEGMLKFIRLERALELARAHHLEDEANAIRLELQELGQENLDLKDVSAQVEVPREEVERHLEWFAGTEDWRMSLSRYGLYGPPSGEPAEVEKALEEQMQRFPLQYLVTKEVVGEHGGLVFRAAEEHDHRRLGMAEQHSLRSMMWAQFGAEALDRIRERHRQISEDELAKYFETDLIDGEIGRKLARSLVLFWDGSYDEAAHLLAPRIEAIVRDTCRRLGIVVTKEPEGERPGGVLMLGTLLDALRGRMEEGWRRYLYTLLSDPLGLNLKNVVSHGLRPEIARPEAALLIHACCYIRHVELSTEPSRRRTK